MVSELEYEIAKVAYGEVEGTIYCMQKMDATPADFDFVFFNNEHDVFRKAAGDPAEPFQFRNPADDMGVDPNRMEIGTNQQVNAPLGSRQAYGDAQRHAANTQWDYEPTQSLFDRQGGYTGPEGQKLAPRWRDRATDWMGRAKRGWGAPAWVGQKISEGMQGLDEYNEGVKQNRKDRAFMEAAYNSASPEQRSQMIQALTGEVPVAAGEEVADATAPETVAPETVTPETVTPETETPTIHTGSSQLQPEKPVTPEMAAAGEEAAGLGARTGSPEETWAHHGGLVNPLTMDMAPFEEGGEYAGAKFHGSPAFGFIPTEGEGMGQVRGLGEEVPEMFMTSGSGGRAWRGNRVVPRTGEGAIIDPATGKAMKNVASLSQIKPAHQMLATIATHPEHYQALQQSLAEGHPGPLMRAIESIKEEAKDHPQMGHLADLSTNKVMQALGQSPDSGMWGGEAGQGLLNTLFQDLGGGREDWMSALQSHRDKPFHWREEEQTPPADLENPPDFDPEDDFVDIPEATPPADLENPPDPDPEIAAATEAAATGRGGAKAPPKRTSSDPLESAWDHLTLLKEGDE